MTQKITAKGHRTVFINKQSIYHIASYKRPRNQPNHDGIRKTYEGIISTKPLGNLL